VNSCLYEGSVRHRRKGSPADEFRHRLYMAYLDLDELPEILDARLLWSARRPALAWFRRADHLGNPSVPLKDSVLDLVQQRTGIRPQGPVRLLTNLRHFGVCFNPVSFYYCFDAADEHVSAVVAHVTNTPWGESHSYVMPVEQPQDHGSTTVMRDQFDKQLHVSPFMGMDHVYDWRLSEPGEQLLVHIDSHRPGGQSVFDATLSLRWRPLSAGSMRRVLLRYPLATLAVLARIYGHALGLKLRGATYFPHPTRRSRRGHDRDAKHPHAERGAPHTEHPVPGEQQAVST
jgi:DUF1365 family protein